MKEISKRLKKRSLLFLFALSLGIITGCVVWLFLFVMNKGIYLLWDFLPSAVSIPFYPIICCGIGGIFVGLWQKRYGPCPDFLMVVIKRIKSEHHIRYDNIFAVIIAALIPLIFGGSIGPEAGLTGIIAGMCYWIGDQIYHKSYLIHQSEKNGKSASLSLVFGSNPLIGLVKPLSITPKNEREYSVSKNNKIFLYNTAAIGGCGAYCLLNTLIHGGSLEMPRLDIPLISDVQEFLWMFAAVAIGVACGILYWLFGKGVGVLLKPLGDHHLLKGVLCGVLLGSCGILLPYTMFSGETQMGEIAESFSEMGFLILLLSGVFKLIIGQLCVQSGWRGGNIFPLIFSGISIGLAASFVIPADPMLLAAATTATLCGYVLRNPIVVILLLFLCFPLSSVMVTALGAFVGCFVPKIFLLAKPEKN